MNALTIETPSLLLEADLVPWDAASFGVPVAQLRRFSMAKDGEDAELALSRLKTWLEHHGVGLAACRLAHSRLLEAAALERIDFRFIEMVYSMQIDLASLQDQVLKSSGTVSIHWRPAELRDLPELQRLAASAFATGRWNVDVHVGQKWGGRRYSDWIRRSLDDPHHQVLCAVFEGHVAGFFITEPSADGSVYWHLTAVAPEWQGRGLGRAMWASMLRRHRFDGATRVCTTISARNIPVINLYARLGWRFVDCQMTFHWASPRWQAKGAETCPN